MASSSFSISNLNEKLTLCNESSSLSENCIFRVSETLRRPNEKVFDPNVVSIGPFHRGQDRLAPMEKIKLWYLRCLLDRLPKPPEETLRYFFDRIAELKIEKHPREYYAEPITLNNYDFIEMMVIDGCFLIELFQKDARLVPRHNDDPIFNSSWMRENLYHDLILLENQIPWFVLELLFQLTNPDGHHELVDLVLGFFKSMMLMTESAKYRPRQGREIKHILDLLHSCLLSSYDDVIDVTPGNTRWHRLPTPGNTRWHRLPTVTDLLQAGIKFKSGNIPGQLFNIKFNDGVFEIPPISIQNNSESLFRNLIAYEQHDRDCTYKFTSYALFLDYLINTSKDVDVLSDVGILQHALSTEDISLLFNRLYNDTLVHDFYYAEVSRKVYKYYKSRWPKWRTTFRREYCKNPWRISSVIAAILILLFTCTQTVFAILSYFFRNM